MRLIMLAATLLAAFACAPVHAAREKKVDPEYMTPIAADLRVEVQQVPPAWFIGADYEEPVKQPSPAKYAALKALIGDYPFNQRLEAALRKRLPGSGLATEPRFVFGEWPVIEAQMKDGMPRAMQITPEWEFTKGGRRFNVGLHGTLSNRAPATSGKLRVGKYFFGEYFFYFDLPSSGSEAENLAAWQAMGRDRLYRMLDEALVQTVDMMVFNFSEEGRALWKSGGTLGKPMLEGRSYGGDLLQKGDGWIWASTGEDEEQTIEGYGSLKLLDDATRNSWLREGATSP